MISKANRSPFATVAMLMAVGAGFTMASLLVVERISLPDPVGPTPRLAPTLPPHEPPKREWVREVKRRSKTERLQRRKKRKQRGK